MSALVAASAEPELSCHLFGMPGHLVRRVHQISTALFAEECGRSDLTAVQYAALATIGAHGELDATRLSGLIAFDRSTIGSVLERLENKGWISRSATAADRRVKRVRLTPAGEALLREVEPAVRQVQRRLLEPLEPSDRAALLDLLGQLAKAHDGVCSVQLQA